MSDTAPVFRGPLRLLRREERTLGLAWEQAAVRKLWGRAMGTGLGRRALRGVSGYVPQDLAMGHGGAVTKKGTRDNEHEFSL